jgi:hypothetical protein
MWYTLSMTHEDKPVAAEPIDIQPSTPGLPPVVARVVVELRSDGTRTVACASVQNAFLGQGVSVQAESRAPIKLALALLRTAERLPFLGPKVAKLLLKSGMPARDLHV